MAGPGSGALFEPAPRDRSLDDPLPPSPLGLVQRWLDEAVAGRVQRNPTAMTVATAEPDGGVSARVVLCRGLDAEAGSVTFYTNRESRKGEALRRSPRGAAVFHWDALSRQLRVEGPIHPVGDAESDAYFATRPRAAQIAAWASDQSRPIASREALHARLAEFEARFGADGDPVPRPPHWGGYRLVFERVELWVAGEGRAHDRALWTRAPGSPPSSSWEATRLQP